MKTCVLFIALFTAAGAYGQDERAIQTLDLTCEICAMDGIAPGVCQSQLQEQANANCAAEGGVAEITDVQVIQNFAGGFCFDGTNGGRLMGVRNAVTFSCILPAQEDPAVVPLCLPGQTPPRCG